MSQILVSKARGRVGMHTKHGLLTGTINTDLADGTYSIRRNPVKTGAGSEHLFVFITKVESGTRFTLDLSESEADPWTLAYTDPCQLVIQAGMAGATPQTPFGQLVGTDLLYTMEDTKARLPGPVQGIDDYETIQYVGDGKYQVAYRDGTSRVIAYADLTPKMLKQYQLIHRQIEAGNLDFVIVAWLGSWPLIEGMVMGAVDYAAPRAPAPKRPRPRGPTKRPATPETPPAGPGGGRESKPPSRPPKSAPNEPPASQRPPKSSPKEAPKQWVPPKGEASGHEMFQSLRQHVVEMGESGASPAAMAAEFERGTALISNKTGFAWQATKHVGADGGVYFTGESQGRILAISPNGEVYSGFAGVDTFHFGPNGASVNYGSLRQHVSAKTPTTPSPK